MTRIGVVTGMRAEAHCLPHSAAAIVRCSGARPGNAGKAAQTLIEQGAEALLSFGLAGGLDPALAPGAVILAVAVAMPDGARASADPDLRARLARCLQPLVPGGGIIAGHTVAVASVAEKARLRGIGGAQAVDMESAAVARIAAAHDVPWAVLRVVADGALRDVPRAALNAIGETGALRVAAVAGSLVVRPWELPAMAVLAIDVRRAFASLRRCGAALAPLFGGALP